MGYPLTVIRAGVRGELPYIPRFGCTGLDSSVIRTMDLVLSNMSAARVSIARTSSRGLGVMLLKKPRVNAKLNLENADYLDTLAYIVSNDTPSKNWEVIDKALLLRDSFGDIHIGLIVDALRKALTSLGPRFPIL